MEGKGDLILLIENQVNSEIDGVIPSTNENMESDEEYYELVSSSESDILFYDTFQQQPGEVTHGKQAHV